jgi:uncharacterized protein (DUF427 family)
MKAIWNNQTIAEADKDQLIYIEGNWYFPSSSISKEFFQPSTHHTICPWKGEANYYDISVGGKTNDNAAWYYPRPLDGAAARVRKDFTDYVAFWHGVTVE